MTKSDHRNSRRTVTPGRRTSLATSAAVVIVAAATAPALAQGWWPWGGPAERPPPVVREPEFREPGASSRHGNPGGWNKPKSICLELEQRLVQEGQRGNQSREQIPAIDAELRKQDRLYRTTERKLERGNCYDYFLFSKTLRRTRRCVDLSRQLDGARRRTSELEAQRRQLMSSTGRSYRNEIIRELARNRCGENYEQQARGQQGFNPFSSLWEDEDDTSGGGLGTYGNVPYATYRTVCVRLCDGYYFPISFSTLPNHFGRDAEACHAKCAAPAELYYYQNPGASVDQAVAAGTNEPYTQLKTAFRYRKEYIAGCSCKATEFVPDPSSAQKSTRPPTVGEAAPAQRADAPTPPDQLPWQPR
jgi:Protein of unknown function (DUF2865)